MTTPVPGRPEKPRTSVVFSDGGALSQAALKARRATELGQPSGDNPPTAARGYAAARAMLTVADAPATEGHVLVWVQATQMGSLHLSAREGAFAVAGSVETCDIVLPGLALRHLLLRSRKLADGGYGIHVFDLQSGVPFWIDEQAGPQTSVFGEGIFSFAVADVRFFAFPAGEAASEELPAVEYEARAQIPTGGKGVLLDREEASFVPPPRRELLGRTSRLALLPQGSFLEDVIAAMARRNTIVIEQGELRASLEVDEKDLDAGVLVGRLKQGFDPVLRKVFSERVSRLHLLLIREAGVLHAYDTGSLNGTFCNGARIRHAEIATELTLWIDGTTLRIHNPTR